MTDFMFVFAKVSSITLAFLSGFIGFMSAMSFGIPSGWTQEEKDKARRKDTILIIISFIVFIISTSIAIYLTTPRLQ